MNPRGAPGPAASPPERGDEPHAPIDVVVVAFGPAEALTGALTALDGRYAVLVVDNGSSPPTARAAADAGARYIDAGANLGFAAGVNVALRTLSERRGDVLLLNPDARITPDAVARLHAALIARPRAACVGPALYAPGSEHLNRSRWPWHTPGSAWTEAVGLARRRLDTAAYFLGGAVLLVRRAAIDEVGPLDERFFLYSEDEDWQRRAIARGWTVHYCPEVTAEHGGGGTEDDRVRLRLRLHAAIERYIRKWYGPRGWALYRAGSAVGLAVRTLARRGPPRRQAVRLLRLYVAGPDRSARRAGVFPAAGPGGNGPVG
jgi:GT2 family glycosyltransferase